MKQMLAQVMLDSLRVCSWNMQHVRMHTHTHTHVHTHACLLKILHCMQVVKTTLAVCGILLGSACRYGWTAALNCGPSYTATPCTAAPRHHGVLLHEQRLSDAELGRLCRVPVLDG